MSKIEEIQAEQGWTDETLGQLALRFIENDNLEHLFTVWLTVIAEAENECVVDSDSNLVNNEGDAGE